jgi:hypothetical protein
MKFGNGVGFSEYEFKPVGEARFSLLGPGYRAFRGKAGNADGNYFLHGGGTRGH